MLQASRLLGGRGPVFAAAERQCSVRLCSVRLRLTRALCLIEGGPPPATLTQGCPPGKTKAKGV